MAQMLVLTDRPQEDERLTAFAVELAHQLNFEGLAAVVARHRQTVLSTSLFLGALDGGLVPQSMPLDVTSETIDTASTRRLFRACQQGATFYGLKCETGRTNVSLVGTALKLASFYKLLMISRDALWKTLGDPSADSLFSSEAATPLLICPRSPRPWQRIIVAARRDVSRDAFIAWGRHWSECLDVPMTTIELGIAPSRSLWATLGRWRPWGSRTRRRQALREQLAPLGLLPSDLLVVDQIPAKWPLTTPSQVSVEDLIAATDCAIAVGPANLSPHVWQFLSPSAVESVA